MSSIKKTRERRRGHLFFLSSHSAREKYWSRSEVSCSAQSIRKYWPEVVSIGSGREILECGIDILPWKVASKEHPPNLLSLSLHVTRSPSSLAELPGAAEKHSRCPLRKWCYLIQFAESAPKTAGSVVVIAQSRNQIALISPSHMNNRYQSMSSSPGFDYIKHGMFKSFLPSPSTLLWKCTLTGSADPSKSLSSAALTSSSPLPSCTKGLLRSIWLFDQ